MQNSYKKYCDHIAKLQFHINRLHNDRVINTDTKNNLIMKIDVIIDYLISKYARSNENVISNSKIDIVDKIDIFDIATGKKNIIDKFYKVTRVDEPSGEGRTGKVHNKLVEIIESYGTFSISDFLKLYINNEYKTIINKYDIEIICLYNKVFVPLKINVKSIMKYEMHQSSFIVNKSINENRYDSLIDNVCTISFDIGIIGINISIEGYVQTDDLNIFFKTSEIGSKYLFGIKKELDRNLRTIDFNFHSKYIKSLNGNVYFANNVNDICEKEINDYKYYNKIISKSQNTLIKEFVKANLRDMFRMIRILLIDGKQNANNAILLFEILKNKKTEAIITSDIIYKNLSFGAKIKLNYGFVNLENELKRIKSLTVDNISIDTKLSAMVNMPDSVKSYIIERNKEIGSGENNYKIQLAINGLMQFPWKEENVQLNITDKSLIHRRNYLSNISDKLNKNIYGHEKSKEVFVELIGKWIQNPNSSGQVIGLSGPPGVGKTLFAKSLGEALGIPSTTIGLGGMSDASDLIGHNSTYSGAQYGLIIRQMIKAGKWRSIMFFDEVDKVAKKHETNEIHNTLIHITDPMMNKHFQDRFYSSSIDFDISGQIFIFSYNSTEKIDPILLERIYEIKVEAYTTRDKILIAQNYIINELCETINFPRDKFIIHNDLLKYIIENYTCEAGVRDLRKKLEKILLKINIDRLYMQGIFSDLISESDNLFVTDDDEINRAFNLEGEYKINLSMEFIHKYLDKPLRQSETIHMCDLVGVTNGLYATDIGVGGIIPIQIFRNHINKNDNDNQEAKLKITGNQKLVMKESVECALTLALEIVGKDHREKIQNEFSEGFHVHVPDGGTPKDGPSAGCAFTTAFVSILLGKKINRFISMTGEIDLTGKILKIGGLHAKLTGAKKSGVKKVFISIENENDYLTIKSKNPELFDDEFKIIIVSHISEIIKNEYVLN